ncbi:hypothetical protein BKA70DRAFT_88437 [Coprinopsis sp. MPI-PUGE-AT-0042]|nr:hypothetical protein BKA70DRAFT_88437 [Coprinopsis sp. MPI-PUGE-AT-0042]
MKLTLATALCATLPCYAALTKGTLYMKDVATQKTVTFTTEFSRDDGRLAPSEISSQPALLVQFDIEKAQTTEVDIEILNGFWIDLYPYLGITGDVEYDLGWSPPWTPAAKLLNVQKTPSATLVPKENAFTACNPNGMSGLPPQASAIWKYDPANGGRLLPTFLAVNGTRLPARFQGNFYQGTLLVSLAGHDGPPKSHGGPLQVFELYFKPATA